MVERGSDMPITYAELIAGGYDRETLDRLIAEYDAKRAARGVSKVEIPGEPKLVRVESGPGWWGCELANWAPASKNEKTKGVWRWHSLRTRSNAALALWRDSPGGPPPATGRRRVTCHIIRQRTNGSLCEPQNCEEDLYDACENSKLIIKDTVKWLERGEMTISKDGTCIWPWLTVLTLENVL